MHLAMSSRWASKWQHFWPRVGRFCNSASMSRRGAASSCSPWAGSHVYLVRTLKTAVSAGKGLGAGGRTAEPSPSQLLAAHSGLASAGTVLGPQPLAPHGRVSLRMTGSCIFCSTCPTEFAKDRSGIFLCAVIFLTHAFSPPMSVTCSLFSTGSEVPPLCLILSVQIALTHGHVIGKCLGCKRQAQVLNSGEDTGRRRAH